MAPTTATTPYVIPQEPVTSSNLASVGYDLERQIIACTFKSGDVWHYAGVSPEIAQALFEAESKGKFYSVNIKGKFAAEKMTGPCPQCGDGPGYLGVTCESCGTAAYAPKEPARG